jgi:transcriptional antiterminator RfaH
MLRWYLIQTKPSSEPVAELNLARQGYSVYFPRAIAPVRRAGRRRSTRRESIVALFPRYLFLQLDEGHQALTPVRSTTGVTDVVRFGSHYAIVPERVIGDLRARADGATGLHRLAEQPELAAGMSVRITVGPFDGLEGVFDRADGADRVVVLLKLLGHIACVRIPLDAVIPCEAAA